MNGRYYSDHASANQLADFYRLDSDFWEQCENWIASMVNALKMAEDMYWFLLKRFS